MTREKHDKAILDRLNSDLDDMGLVDEDKVETAREAIVQTVTTLLDRLAAANGNGVGGKTASEILLYEANASYSKLLADRDSEIERLKGALEMKDEALRQARYFIYAPAEDLRSGVVCTIDAALANAIAASKAEAAEPKDCYCGGTSDYHSTGCPEAAEQRSHDLERGK